MSNLANPSPGPYRVSDGVVFRELDGESVILNLDSGMYFGLDRVGTRVWQLIEEHGRLDAVVERLVEEYDVAPDVLRADVATLVAALVDKGLVVATPEVPPGT